MKFVGIFRDTFLQDIIVSDFITLSELEKFFVLKICQIYSMWWTKKLLIFVELSIKLCSFSQIFSDNANAGSVPNNHHKEKKSSKKTKKSSKPKHHWPLHPQTENYVEKFSFKILPSETFCRKRKKSNLHFHNFSISPKIKRQPEANLRDLKKSNFEEKNLHKQKVSSLQGMKNCFQLLGEKIFKTKEIEAKGI